MTGIPRLLRAFHCAPHDARVHHRASIIGDGDGPGLFHGSNGSQLFALASLGDGSDGEHVHAGQPFGPLHDVTGDGSVVVYRRGVGHRADGSKSTRGGGLCAGFDGFGVLKARFTQVYVHVDEARRNDQPGGIKAIRSRWQRQTCPHRLNNAIPDQNIPGAIEAGSRIYHPSILNEQRGHFAPSAPKLSPAPPYGRICRSPPGLGSRSAENQRLPKKSRGPG